MRSRNVRRCAGVVLCAAVTSMARTAPGADDVAGNLMLVNDNGAWSWFEDERAIVDSNTGNVLVGTIGDASVPTAQTATEWSTSRASTSPTGG